jgi:hypothetical protein
LIVSWFGVWLTRICCCEEQLEIEREATRCI